MAPIQHSKCETREDMRKVNVKMTSRKKEHDIKINRLKQVQKKVDDASKALIRVEYKNDDIKIMTNSGNFKMISEEVMKLDMGDEMKTDREPIASVTDKHWQVDINQIPYMVKTEFRVKNTTTNFDEKAVLHTYLTTSCFMIQGNGKVTFYEKIMKMFIENIMKNKVKDIIFINKTLQNLTQNLGKRKMPAKNIPCDICGRTLVNLTGVNIHKKRMHVVGLPKAIKYVVSLKRSDSIKSPPPKMKRSNSIKSSTCEQTLLAIEYIATEVKTDPEAKAPVQPDAVLQAPGQPAAALQAPVQPTSSLQAPVQPAAALQPEAQAPVQPAAVLQAPVQPTSSVQAPVQPAAALEAPGQTAADLHTPVQPSAAPKSHVQPVSSLQPLATIQDPRTVQSSQGTSEVPMEGYEINDEIRLAKEEITMLKSEKQREKLQHALRWKVLQDETNQIKSEYEKNKKEEKAKNNALLKEKESIVQEMMKQNKEKELAVAKLQAELEKSKMLLTLKSFRFDSTEKKDEEEPPTTDDIEECIVNVKCAGNCEHISCRMQTMRLQGGRRTTPADAPRTMHTCTQCGFNVTSKSELEKHMKTVHTKPPTCPYCQVKLHNLSTLKSHIDTMHNKSEARPKNIQNGVTNTRPICVFNLQPRGCKKGQSCNYSHDTNNQLNSSQKVRKMCNNGPDCTWKPGCRYVHPEDGEVIPPRAPREGGRVSNGRPCYWSPSDCPRGGPGSCNFVHRPEDTNQGLGFATPNLNQQPPDSNLTEFPGLPAPKRPSVFQMNPQFSQ